MPVTIPSDGLMYLQETDGANLVRLKYMPGMVQDLAATGELLSFDGRAFPLGFTGEGTSDSWRLNFLVNQAKDGADQWDNVRRLVDERRGRTLIWQDHMGTAIYVWLLAASREIVPHPSSATNRLAKVSFTLNRVDYP
jgi:hypothetical protein